VNAVEVIGQVKDPWQARARVLGFFPRTIFLLRAKQISNAASYRFAARVACRQQSKDGPGGLRRRARPYTFGSRVIVRATSLAPAAVRILEHAQPLSRLLDIRLMVVHA